LKFSPQENSNKKTFVKENVESSRRFYFSKWEKSQLIN
jgi:hypothetical protein